MHVGISYFVTDQSMRPDDVARIVEEVGFESLWFPEHTHIPVSRESSYPRGGPLPDHYRRTLDQLVALTAAASATRRIRLGTGVCLIAEHDPINLAKQIATLDYMSEGRVEFGVGAGWNREEMANHGVAFADRWRVMDERIDALRVLWTEETPEYHGDFVDFDPIWMWPKPVQKPHPPILLGLNGPSALQRVLALRADWMPNEAGSIERIPLLQQMASQVGVDPVRITTWVRSYSAEELDSFAARGVTRSILHVPVDSREAQLARIAEYAKMAEPWLTNG